jgi:hypothetical protein
MRIQLSQVSTMSFHVIILANLGKNFMFRKVLPVLALIPVIINAFAYQQTWFGILAIITYGVACGLALGTRLAANTSRSIQAGVGMLATIAILSILGSLTYYVTSLTTTNLCLVLVFTALIASATYQSNTTRPTPWQRPTGLDCLVFCLGILALISWWHVALTHPITEPVRSLWLQLSPLTLVSLGVASMCVVTLFLKSAPEWMRVSLLGASVWSGLLLAAWLYPNGYGFDPFLHRATVEYIAEYGTITPKPLYYIGQYALETLGVKIFSLPLFFLDTWLVPTLAAWSAVLILLLRQKTYDSSSMLLGASILLPFAAFVQTTPQALAFVFTLITLCLPVKSLWLPALFASAALITHPLAGIGAALYVAFLSIDTIITQKLPKLVTTAIVFSLGAIAIPLAFFAQAKMANLPISFKPEQLLNLTNLPLTSFLSTAYNFWGDTAYIFIGNAFLIVLVLALAGFIIMPATRPGKYLPGLTALAIFINFVVLSLGFDFTFLISYERLDFAVRLITLCTLCLLPYVAETLAYLQPKMTPRPLGLVFGFISLCALLFTGNVYAAYPRHDNYSRSSGFNVGPNDINSVYAIDKYATHQAYIVLSDQALAAAAVQELGFKQYYHGDIFFYPIPTGGQLYQSFLDMVEKVPQRETVITAMDLTGVDLAFFAVHDYWWQAPQIIENTKAIADDWFSIGQNQVTIFVFQRQP